jgi:hypothetical protein
MTAGDGDAFVRGDAVALGVADEGTGEETASAAGCVTVGGLPKSLIITTMTTSTAAVQSASSDSMILARR